MLRQGRWLMHEFTNNLQRKGPAQCEISVLFQYEALLT